MPIGNIVVVRGPGRRRSSLTDLSTYKGRQRNYGDFKYPPSHSDLRSYAHSYSDTSPRYNEASPRYNEASPRYNDTSPRYTTQYGRSDLSSARDSYFSYPNLSGSHYSTDGGSMSKYTRSYDTQRLFDRGKADTEIAAPSFEFGVSYTSPRTHDTSTKTYDRSTRNDDRSTRIDDVTTDRSLAYTSSLSDRDWSRSGEYDIQRREARQRGNSADSNSSHSSDRSGSSHRDRPASTSDDRTLFNALKNRYRENAEKPSEDPGKRAPFSTWRRSGHFDDTSSSPHDIRKEKSPSLTEDRGGETFHKSESASPARDYSTAIRDMHREARSKAVEERQQDLQQSADGLISDFRKALHRHHISQNDKAGKDVKPAETTEAEKPHEDEETVSDRLERLRAVRAKLKEQRSERVKSEGFATEYKPVKDKNEKQRSNSARSSLSQKLDRSEKTMIDKSRPGSTSKIDDKAKTKDSPKTTPKLARQKLVSDDLKAKFIEHHKDEKEKDLSRSKDDALLKKRSQRKSKHKEHMEYWKKENEIGEESKPVVELESMLPTADEMLLGSTKHDLRSESAKKKFENVDHSSPFGSVYTKPSNTGKTTEPTSSSSLSSSQMATNFEKEKEKLKKDKQEMDEREIQKKQNQTVTESKSDSLDKARRKYKKHIRAKTDELGALSKEEKVEPIVEAHDDSVVDSATTVDNLASMTRQERIAKYKEERRKQLATVSNRFSGGGELPSLFLSSKSAKDGDAELLRSKSMKVESDTKSDLGPSSMSRSKSLKQEKLTESPDVSSMATPKMSGLNLAEIGSKLKSDDKDEEDVYGSKPQFNTDNIIDRLAHLKRLKDEYVKKAEVKKAETSKEDIQSKTSGKKGKELNNVSKLNTADTSSYASKALLADKVSEDTNKKKTSRLYARTNLKEKETIPSSHVDNAKVQTHVDADSKQRSQSERTEKSAIDGDSRVKSRTFSEKMHERDTEGKNLFEFGTVYTKRERGNEGKQTGSKLYDVSDSSDVETIKDKERLFSDRDSESGRESVDSYSRIRRRLPSVEDVLGTNLVEKEQIERLRQSVTPDKTDISKQKEHVLEMSGDDIQRKKIAQNIEKAKSKFRDEDKKMTKVEPSVFEFGTSFDSKKTEIPAPKTIKKADVSLSAKDTEKTRQLLLGVDDTEKHAKPHYKISKKKDHLQNPSDISQISEAKSSHTTKGDRDVPAGKPPTSPRSSPRSDRKKVTETSRLPTSPRLDKKKVNESSKLPTSPRTDRKKVADSSKIPSPSTSRKKVAEATPQVSSPKTDKKKSATSKLPTSPRSSKKVLDEASKPPTSPRTERKKTKHELKFGKQSHDASEPFEFGTVYTKKETPKQVKKSHPSEISKEKVVSTNLKASADIVEDHEKPAIADANTNNKKTISQPKSVSGLNISAKSTVNAAKETVKVDSPKSIVSSIKLTSQTSTETEKKMDMNDVSKMKQTSDHDSEKTSGKQDNVFKFDIKAQSVSTASGQSFEVPTSPRRQSPTRKSEGQFRLMSPDTTVISPTQIGGINITNIKSTSQDSKDFTVKQNEVRETKGIKIDTITSSATDKSKDSRESKLKPISSVTSVAKSKSDGVETGKQAQNQKDNVSKDYVGRKFDDKSKATEPEVVRKTSFTSLTLLSPTDKKRGSESKLEPPVESSKPQEERSKHQVKTSKPQAESSKPAEAGPAVKEKGSEKISAPVSDKVTKPAVDNETAKPIRSKIDKTAKVIPDTTKIEKSAGQGPVTVSKPIKKESFKPAKKDERPVKKDSVEKSKDDERSRKLERTHPKLKAEKPVMTKIRVDKLLMDASLDDILSKNVEYLSDLEPPEFSRGRTAGKKSRPLSIHEQQKPKRSLKKKTMRRTKSEDRSHFKVIDSDEDPVVIRAKVKEELQRSAAEVKDSSGDKPKPIAKLPDVTEGRQLQSLPTDEGRELQPQPVTAESADSARESETSRFATDSDHSSVSSAMSEGSRKRRKDKSSLRKSKLNESSDDATAPIRKREPDDPVSRTARVGVRRVSSSRLARESREDKYTKDVEKEEILTVLQKHDIEIPRGSDLDRRGVGRSEDKRLTNTDSKHHSIADSTVRGVNKSVLDSHSVLPSRFALPSKVSTAISKLSEVSERNNKDGSSGLKRNNNLNSPRGIRRGNNFANLLQKFSSSEASSSEKSDTDTHSPRGRKTHLHRQEAYAVSSPSSDDNRRVPERTQSLKLRGSPAPAMEKDMNGSVSAVQRSSSFKSDFMKRRFSPEPESRRRLPATPNDQSDKPTPELANVLSKRSEIVQKQQKEGEVVERERIHDGKVAKADRFSAAGVEEVIADNEVQQRLRSRRKETDSSLEGSSVSESDNKSHVSKKSQGHATQNMSQTSKDSVSAIESRSVMDKKVPEDRPKLASQRSFESKTSINLSTIGKVEPKMESESVKKVESEPLKKAKEVSEPVKTVSKSLVKDEKSVDAIKVDLSSTGRTRHVGPVIASGDIDDLKHSKPEREEEKQDARVNISSPSANKIVQSIQTVKPDRTEQVTKLTASTDIIVPKTEVKVQSKLESVSAPIRDEERFRRSTSPQSGVIDITSKSDIMKKISTRDRTPERQSPKKAGPMRVTSQSKSASGLTRTESVGRTESERPKGILKRTPSLKQAGVIVDPELAEVLKTRRQRHDEVDEEEEGEKLTAQEEIRRQRELQAAKSQDEGRGDGDGGREVSVAERVFQMHNKIEEVKSCPITPRARSGFTTPKSLQRSGNISPKFSFDDEGAGGDVAPISGPQLIERLSSLEGQQRSSQVSEKRERFQQRQRDDPRTRTQPVTLQEIQLADSLETVRKFRAEVIQKSSRNVFEALQKQEKTAQAKKTEFPQPFLRDRRPRNQRHKTLPITAAELSAVPEGQVTETMNTLKMKFEHYGARDSKADSGILSGSDGDNLSIDENVTISEDDPVKMSVSAKASMFHQIQETLKEKPDKRSASGAKRYIDRKKRERSRTLPITEDEVKLAAEIADEEMKAEEKKAEATPNEPVPLVEEGDGHAPDELTKQSLKDKVKLFTSIEEDKKAAAQKKVAPAPPPKRRGRKLASRFATQPITYEEVEKAAKISPLACSLIKPPDPDILRGLSIKDARELTAQHAQQTLSQPGSRQGSRATSITDLSANVTNTDALTVSNTNANAQGDSSDTVRPSDVRSKGFGIIKHDEHKSSHTVEKFSTDLDSTKKSILKSELEQKLSLGILKPRTDASPTVSDIKNVLRKDSSLDKTKTMEVKSILKKEGSFETKKPDSAVLKPDLSGKDVKSVAAMAEVVEALEDSEKFVEGLDSSGDNLDSDEGILDNTNGSATGGKENREDGVVLRRKGKTKRRFNRDRTTEQERYRTQPAEGVSEVENDQDGHLKKKYAGRHLTQPITGEEKKEAEIATEIEPVTEKTGSIHDRLNALKKSGDEEWKKRVSRPLDLDSLERRSMSPPVTPPNVVKMRERKDLDLPRPSSIADRLTLLDSAQEGWRGRVGETDVKKFTLENKLSSSSSGNLGESPMMARLRNKTPRREGSKDSISSETSDLASPTSPTKENSKIPVPREVVCTDIPIEVLQEDIKLASIPSVEEDKPATSVAVPNINEEMDRFFQTPGDMDTMAPEQVDVTIDDFNELFMNSGDILETTKKIKPKRRHGTKSRNPLKTMSACLDVRTEYTEVITGVAERELKRVKTSAISQNSGFAVEALAGLASVENFSKVELRKTEPTGAGTSAGGNTRLDPYLPLMLIHIKGRRKVQCRLVEPVPESINSGDCYVLLTRDKIINWVGDYCNVIEKAKAADICDFVKQKRDMGCKKAREVVTVEEKRGTLGGGRHFWDLLGGIKPIMDAGPVEEDEIYETHIMETNMVYRLEKNKLVAVEEYWGGQPKYEMLQPDQVFVFDFGSELYLWQGKAVTLAQRKISLKLAQTLWDQGYDYSSCDINPISPLKGEEDGGLPSKASARPDWVLFGKVNQNMETILFREKFADWPDTSRLIQVKSQEEVNMPKFDLADLKAYDAKLMVPVDTSPVSMVLEGSHVGRGNKWEVDMEGFMQTQHVETLKVRVWHVLEYEHYEIESHSYGQFHEGDTYVVRWQYMITKGGMKNLKGEASRHSQKGRERCAYFFWQGKTSTVNEKGASALMTVELDEERGPQVRVSEGKEPPCFLNLFKGRMIIHIGKREEEETNTQGPWRCYCLRNEYDNEMCLIEVERDVGNLRSVSSGLFLNVITGKLMVWHGCKSPEHTKTLALTAAKYLKERCPLEVGLHKNVSIDIVEMEEGQEKTEFWRMLNVHLQDRSGYHSLLKNQESFSHTLRLFHMTSVSGVFEVTEIVNPSRTPELHTRFPVLQTDLYRVSQPALFLVDNGHEIYLWQGWWPEGDEDQENVLTGSAQTRFTADRRCAMETTIQYCKEINPSSRPPAYLVYAGLEPLSFTNLFPFWNEEENIKDINLRDGKAEGQLVSVEQELKKLTKTRYTFAELVDETLPEGVDPLKLETYLADDEFERILDMTREEYYALPAWKQSKVKQQVGLF